VGQRVIERRMKLIERGQGGNALGLIFDRFGNRLVARADIPGEAGTEFLAVACCRTCGIEQQVRHTRCG
jgi:hypothetical protein